MSQNIVHLREMRGMRRHNEIDNCIPGKMLVESNLVLELLRDVSYRHTTLSNDLSRDKKLGPADKLQLIITCDLRSFRQVSRADSKNLSFSTN